MTRLSFALGPRFKYFWLPLAIAAWTILQSLAHAWWVVYGRGMLACEVQVKRQLEFYLYMTYLYSNDCDNKALNPYARINFKHDSNDSVTWMLPVPRMYNEDGTMTESLMDLYLASDGVWIVASVGLLVGVVMKLKQGSALIFYLPWILVAVVVIAMDLFSSIYFALLLPSAKIILSAVPMKLEKSTIMAIMSGRLGLIWILNVSNMAYIIWYTRVSYNQRYSDERIRRKPKMRRQDTENRIKNWQLFYGELDDSTVGGNHACNHKSSFVLEEDLNYTTTFKELEEYNDKRRKFEGSTEPELCSTFKSSSSITNENTTASAQSSEECKPDLKKKVQITELVSHLPWSYINSGTRFPAVSKSKDDSDEMDVRPKKVVVLEPSRSGTNCHPVNEQVSRF